MMMQMNELAGKYQGMDRYEARKQIVKDLEELGLLLKVEDHTHNVGTCYRCATVIEPLISKQWFVKMNVPERFSKIYFNWMEKYFKAALVGTQNTGLLLSGMRLYDG